MGRLSPSHFKGVTRGGRRVTGNSSPLCPWRLRAPGVKVLDFPCGFYGLCVEPFLIRLAPGGSFSALLPCLFSCLCVLRGTCPDLSVAADTRAHPLSRGQRGGHHRARHGAAVARAAGTIARNRQSRRGGGAHPGGKDPEERARPLHHHDCPAPDPPHPPPPVL